jgi:hypothetical protein
VGFKKGGSPADPQCIRRYNASPVAVSGGAHAYTPGHDSRAGHVFRITKREVPLVRSCAVIFATRDSDREYGILGEIEFLTAGWDGLANLSVTPTERAQIQRKGAEEANVALKPDGTIVPLGSGATGR